MGLINTNNRLAIFESINAWIKRPKHIMQKSSVIYIGGVWYDRTPEYPDPDQHMLVATFATFGKTLPNRLLFRILYLLVRRLMALIFRLYHKPEMLNWGNLILT